jgi:Tol biopolymer transport system component
MHPIWHRIILFFVLMMMVAACSSGPQISGITEQDLTADPELAALVGSIDDAPENADNYLALAAYLEAKDDISGAISALNTGIQKLPQNNRLRLRAAKLQINNGQQRRAYENFRVIMNSVEAPAYVDEVAPFFGDVYSFRSIISSSSDEAYPSVDSAGTYIYYQANPNGHWDIYRVPLSGGTPERILDLPSNEENPTIAPNNDQLLLVSDLDDERPVPYKQKLRDIYLYDLASKEMLNLTENFSADYMPRFCKFGREVVFVSERNDLREDVTFMDRFSNIFTMEPSGKFQIAVTKGEYLDSNPSYSCDQTKIFFDSNRGGTFQNVYTYDLESKEIKQLLPAGNYNNFSPYPDSNDQLIVYVSDRDGNYELYSYNFSTYEEERLTSSTAEELNPVFIPNKNQILFHSNRNGSYDIFVMDLDQKSLAPTPSSLLNQIENKLMQLGPAEPVSSN